MVITMSYSTIFFTATAVGVVSHLATLDVVWDHRVWLLLQSYTTALGALLLVFPFVLGYGPLSAIAMTVFVATSFNIGVISSMVIYRLFFHRLSGFPGPFWARITRFYAVYISKKRLQYFLDVQQFHRTYGDFIRTGPRDLSICRASAVQAIYGPQSKCVKSNWYGEPTDRRKSLQTTCSPEIHKRRRKTWDQAFSMKALASYQPRVKAKVDLLIAQLTEREGEPVNISNWAMFFAFDVMGDLGFGKDFHMLDKGKEDDATLGIHNSMSLFGYMNHVIWLLHFLASIPGLVSPINNFRDWCEGQVVEKQQNFDPEATPTDIFSWLLKENTFKDELTGYWKAADPAAMAEDSKLIIIAGSDTTSIALAYAIYYLIKTPRVYTHLQSLLDSIFPSSSTTTATTNTSTSPSAPHTRDMTWTYDAIKSLPYLDAIINETLRLKPPVPSGLYRQTPPEGLWIDDEVFIPGDVHVAVPTYALQRDERYWERAGEFWPERWLGGGQGGGEGERKGEKKMVPDAYIPFSIGTYSCIGRVLALVELRSALSRLALNFDLAFAPGETGRVFDEGVRDTFTFAVRDLRVVFTRRR